MDKTDVSVMGHSRHSGSPSESPLRPVISMGRRNTLVFDGKMECWNELQVPDIFYQ